MKKIYIVITQTGTLLSNIIKLLKKTDYNHVSLALEPSLETMYSFGRIHPYNAFIGGFVEESISCGTFKRFKDTKCKVFSLIIEDSQYKKIEDNINIIKRHKDKYKFNIHGLVNAEFDIYKKYENKFFCSEFVKYILEKANVNLGEFSKVPHPQNFAYIPNLNLQYTGLLQNYPNRIKPKGNDLER